MNIQIQILKPEVKGILDQLVKLKLIKITNKEDNKLFTDLLTRVRGNSADEISIEEITNEVESIREKKFKGNQSID